MKKLLLSSSVLCLALCMNVSAQTTVTTWYIIPPTSGCNGVWAVDAQTYGPCSFGAQYNMNPMGCVQLGGPTVADTTYLTLCAFPCDLYLVNSSGGTCICSTGTFTNVDPLSEQFITTTYPNPTTSSNGWNVWLNTPGSSITVNIYNSLGELVSVQSSDHAEQIFHVDASGLAAGNYVAEVSVNGAAPYRQNLILTQ